MSRRIRPLRAATSGAQWLFLAFLSLAAGSILYVVIELLGVANTLGYKDSLCTGLIAGLFFGFATDMVLVARRRLEGGAGMTKTSERSTDQRSRRWLPLHPPPMMCAASRLA